MHQSASLWRFQAVTGGLLCCWHANNACCYCQWISENFCLMCCCFLVKAITLAPVNKLEQVLRHSESFVACVAVAQYLLTQITLTRCKCLSMHDTYVLPTSSLTNTAWQVLICWSTSSKSCSGVHACHMILTVQTCCTIALCVYVQRYIASMWWLCTIVRWPGFSESQTSTALYSPPSLGGRRRGHKPLHAHFWHMLHGS